MRDGAPERISTTALYVRDGLGLWQQMLTPHWFQVMKMSTRAFGNPLESTDVLGNIVATSRSQSWTAH